jgi:predicted hotdog family 3-hydroxylacyl-ACP dehydratase
VLIDAPCIADLIPHHGDMVLLDRVLTWDAAHIRCASWSHRNPRHPLHRHGHLGILCGVEYAAQAMAVHGALIAGDGVRAPGGYLASLRSLSWSIDRLDLIADELLIEAERLHGEDNRVMYRFAIIGGGQTVLQGRAAVVLGVVAP